MSKQITDYEAVALVSTTRLDESQTMESLTGSVPPSYFSDPEVVRSGVKMANLPVAVYLMMEIDAAECFTYNGRTYFLVKMDYDIDSNDGKVIEETQDEMMSQTEEFVRNLWIDGNKGGLRLEAIQVGFLDIAEFDLVRKMERVILSPAERYARQMVYSANPDSGALDPSSDFGDVVSAMRR